MSNISTTVPEFQPKHIKGVFLSFVSLLLLGMLPVISNSRPKNLESLPYAFYLSFWELICALPLTITESFSKNRGIFAKNLQPRLKRKTLSIMIITGAIFSVSTYFYVFSLEKAGTISAAIAIQTYPLFSIMIETLFFHKKKHWSELISTIFIITGLYSIGTRGTFLISDFSIWFAVALITPFLWSIAHVTIKHHLDRSPITPNQVTFIRVLVSSLILGILSYFVYGSDEITSGFVNIQFQKFAFLMGLVYYLELINWFYAVKHVNVSVASSITTPSPVITMVFAFIFLRERVYNYHYIGMTVVFIGLFSLVWTSSKHSKSNSAHGTDMGTSHLESLKK